MRDEWRVECGNEQHLTHRWPLSGRFESEIAARRWCERMTDQPEHPSCGPAVLYHRQVTDWQRVGVVVGQESLDL